MKEVSKEEGLIMALERKTHELQDKINEQHGDLVAQDRKIDELEAMVRGLENALSDKECAMFSYESSEQSLKAQNRELFDRFDHCVQQGFKYKEQIDQLEAKVRDIQALYDAAIRLIMERDTKIDDLNALLDSADRQAKEDAKLVRNLRALLDEGKLVADHWRELAFKLEDEIRGAA